jgi:serine/threonine protein kinase
MQPELIGGRYRVESAIGRGGMGTVWLCLDETLHRRVAVKQVGLLPGESVTDSARAFREARSSAGLSHRNVVAVFDVVEEAGHIWLVMEHVPGRSLSQVIKQDGPLDPEIVAGIGAEIADGLSALHADGIMHRDVKPGNVLIREDGVAKISDFGIARTAGDATLTQAGYLTGTPSYFSPALARGAEPTPADDVWALGATLYAAVEGHPPYPQRDNPVQVLHEITTRPPLVPQRAQFLEPALQRMLDRDPSSRWSMADAVHTLRRLADAHRPDATLAQTRINTGAFSPEPPETPDHGAHGDIPDLAPSPRIEHAEDAVSTRSEGRIVPRASRRRRTRPAVVALLLLLLCGVVVFAATHLGFDPTPPSATGAKATKDSTRTKSSTKLKSRGSKSATASSSSSSSSTSTGSQEAFIRDYYAKAPGGSDEAWNMLAPAMQSMGRDRYFGFWRTIRSVEVREVHPSSDGKTVDVTLVYRTTDGQTSTERKREVLGATDGGGYQIESDVSAN